MAKDTKREVMAEVLERAANCTLDELCLACEVEAEWVAELVEHGVLAPVGRTRAEWRFQGLMITHVAKAKRLERDLGLNTPGVALALDLLEEIAALRARLKVYESQSL